MNGNNKGPLAGASMAMFFSVAAYWTMPVFAGGAICASMLAAILATYCAYAGALKTSLVAMYFCIAASVPFWVSQDSTFNFGQGYLWLGPAGLVLAVVLLLFGRRITGAT
ncbi:hypothetical protein [Seongchinamella sediminis]|nr:hypothetical protein [Seongchinamella sediminis]